jgi:CDP-diglyceride synthetase
VAAGGASASDASSAAEGGAPPTLLVDEPAAKRWRDWRVRLFFAFLMIGGVFAFLFSLKQVGVVLLIFVLQSLI